MDSTSTENVREDAVSQVLGKDRHGRVRGMGRAVNMLKVDYLNARDTHVIKLEKTQAEMQTKIEELQNLVHSLAGKKASCEDVDAQSNVSNITRGGAKCKILDWFSSEDVVVGEGEFYSAEPSYKIDQIPLGPNAAAVTVKYALNPDAYVWRPTTTVYSIGQTVGTKIQWPADRLVLATACSSPTRHEPAGSKASDESSLKCNIFAWNGNGEKVAEGVMRSVDPDYKVNQIPLGPNAAVMMVEKVIVHDAFLWRPSSEMAVMGDALNATIAWPLDKVEFIIITPEVSPKSSPGSTSNSTGSSKGARKKCILFDCNNSGKIVAEGHICSTDPADRVHFIPLGPNASKVWIDVSKIGDAEVWRPNSEIQYVADAIGTTVAWPNDKLKLV